MAADTLLLVTLVSLSLTLQPGGCLLTCRQSCSACEDPHVNDPSMKEVYCSMCRECGRHTRRCEGARCMMRQGDIDGKPTCPPDEVCDGDGGTTICPPRRTCKPKTSTTPMARQLCCCGGCGGGGGCGGNRRKHRNKGNYIYIGFPKKE